MSTSTTPRRRLGPSLRTLSSVLILSGSLLIADALLTVTWQEPLSALYSRMSQDSLADQLTGRAQLDAPSGGRWQTCANESGGSPSWPGRCGATRGRATRSPACARRAWTRTS